MAKTTMMVLDRNFTLRSTLGHMLTFKKDVPMPVVQVMVRSCGEIGATRVDGKKAIEPIDDAKAEVQPIDPGQRLEDIAAAIEKLVETNVREEFTAGGQPNVKAVSEKVGYKVDRNEVMKVWRQRAEDLANDA